jgi:putative colanic acid biosynthesis acetyltransferase WcaF
MKGFRYYTRKEIALRILWGIVCPIFFYSSPRLFYKWRNFVLSAFGAKLGKNVKIYPSTKISHPWLLEIGNDTLVSWNVTIYNLGRVTLGSKTIISQNVHLCAGTHDYNSGSFALQRCQITIGNNVWIAADAFIGPNVIVCDQAIVAARAVVIKNVTRLTMVGGNPAVILKNLSKGIREN